ncbi:MAG TPA: polyhydroxyalkanoic acid system family protein [Hyphomicrobiales bacterium]|nr:polyhydroxyalkanoic acid system family protein [Hyphomicrobiales bacterium]
MPTTPLTITVPHGMTRAEALVRIRSNFDKAAEQAKPYVTSIEDQWEGDVLNVKVAALGRDFTGRVEALEDAVKIEVDLPHMFGWLKGRVRKVLTRHAPRLLEAPEAARRPRRARA